MHYAIPLALAGSFCTAMSSVCQRLGAKNSEATRVDLWLIVRLAREAQLEERTLWQAYENAAMDKAKAAGIEIIPVADKAPFQAAVKPVWDKYGPRFAELIKRIQAVE